jgi:hypothetical protein
LKQIILTRIEWQVNKFWNSETRNRITTNVFEYYPIPPLDFRHDAWFENEIHIGTCITELICYILSSLTCMVRDTFSSFKLVWQVELRSIYNHSHQVQLSLFAEFKQIYYKLNIQFYGFYSSFIKKLKY